MSDTIQILQEAITSDNDSQVLRTIDVLLGTIPYPFNTANLDALIASCTISKNVLIQKLAKAFLEFIKDPKSDKKNALVNRDPLLLWACDKSMSNMAQALLREGANPNVADVNGDTPLLVACDRKQTVVANQLIDSGVNVNASNSLGITPILLCNKNNMQSVVTALIGKGATPPAPVVPAAAPAASALVPAAAPAASSAASASASALVPAAAPALVPAAAPAASSAASASASASAASSAAPAASSAAPAASSAAPAASSAAPAPAASASALTNMPKIGDIVDFLEMYHTTPRKLMYITTPNDDAYTFDITSTLQKRKAEIQMHTIKRTTALLTENYKLENKKLSDDEYILYNTVKEVLDKNITSVENTKEQILQAITPVLNPPSNTKAIVNASVRALKATGATTTPVRIWTRKGSTGGGRRLRLTSAAE